MRSAKNSADVAIIGGGPGGISAALWCDELGMNAVLIEQESDLGGQLRHIHNPIENYPGVTARDGLEMIFQFEKTIRPRNFVRRTGIQVKSIDVRTMEVHFGGPAENEKLSCRAIIVATGVRRRLLHIPGEADFFGKGILESGARDKASVAGKRVLIVGGGDAAFENALILSEFAESVGVAYRKPEPSARREFVEAAQNKPNVGILPSTVVTRIAGNRLVENVALRDGGGRERTEAIDAVLIRIGVEPNSELVRGIVDLDDAGYIKADHTGKTNSEGVYAVGDVANRISPTISTATGTGATAAKAIFHSIRHAKAL